LFRLYSRKHRTDLGNQRSPQAEERIPDMNSIMTGTRFFATEPRGTKAQLRVTLGKAVLREKLGSCWTKPRLRACCQNDTAINTVFLLVFFLDQQNESYLPWQGEPSTCPQIMAFGFLLRLSCFSLSNRKSTTLH
jgi:hypothetical protein